MTFLCNVPLSLRKIVPLVKIYLKHGSLMSDITLLSANNYLGTYTCNILAIHQSGNIRHLEGRMEKDR